MDPETVRQILFSTRKGVHKTTSPLLCLSVKALSCLPRSARSPAPTAPVIQPPSSAGATAADPTNPDPPPQRERRGRRRRGEGKGEEKEGSIG